MDRDIPVFNRPVIDKINKKNQEKHLERLRKIKSGNGNRTMPLGTFQSLSNKKGLLAEEQKRTQIQKQNVILFNKMMRIMKRSDPYNQPHKMQQISRINKVAEENSRIMEQNRGIFQRLQHQRPTISNKKLYEDRIKNLNILKFLGKYPNPSAAFRTSNYQSMASQMGRQSQHKRNYDYYSSKMPNLRQFALDQTTFDDQIRSYQQQYRRMKERSLQTSDGRRKFLSQAITTHKKTDSQGSEDISKIDVTSHALNYVSQQRKKSKGSYRQQNQPTHPEKQIILFQKKCIVALYPAVVQFIRLYHVYKIRAIFEESVKGQYVHQLQIPEQEGNQFFSQNNYDYAQICKMLTIQDGILVINPNRANEKTQKNEMLQPKSSQKIMTAQLGAKINTYGDVEDGQTEKWLKYEQALQEYIE